MKKGFCIMILLFTALSVNVVSAANQVVITNQRYEIKKVDWAGTIIIFLIDTKTGKTWTFSKFDTEGNGAWSPVIFAPLIVNGTGTKIIENWRTPKIFEPSNSNDFIGHFK